MASLVERLAEIAGRYRLTTIYVFGSRATEIAARVRGQMVTPEPVDSDVDIGVQPKRDYRLTAQERVELTIELEDLFEVDHVDLIVLPEANPFLAVEVIRGEILFCNDLDAQAEDELYILRRAGDLAHYERQRWAQIIMGEAP